MATIGKVAAVFTASTGGLKSGVADATRSFRQLGGDAARLTSSFATLRSAGARGVGDVGPAAERAASKLQTMESMAARLQEGLARGTISAEDFARRMGMIGDEATRMAASVSRGIAITSEFSTAEQRHAGTINELNALLADGTISQDTYARATAQAEQKLRDETGVTAAQTAAMNSLAAVMQRGAAVTESVATADERHSRKVKELKELLAAGAINQNTFNRAMKQADEELNKAKGGADKFADGLKKDEDGLRGVHARLNTLIGLQAAQLFTQLASMASNAARSLYGFAQSEANTIDKTSKLATRMGMTYGEFAGLSHAAALADVSMETVGKAATKADIAFVKASQGSRMAQQAFAGIGLSVDQLQNKTPAERFQMIADAIAALPTAAERARAATALFGKSGAELLPMFEGGAGAIRDAVAEADKFGLALTTEQGQAVERMNDGFTNVYESIRGVVGQVVAYLAPALEQVTTTFTNLIGGIGGANIGQFIGEAILQGAVVFAGIADYFVAGATSLWEYASQVGAQWNGIWEYANRAAAFFAGVGDGFRAALAAAMFGVVTVFQKVIDGLKWAADALGYSSQLLDQTSAALGGAGESLGNEMTKSAESAAKNLKYAFTGEGGPENKVGQAVAGPLQSALQDAIDKAKANASAVTVSAPQTVGPAKVEAPSGPSTEQLKATDSRSKEGVAEMFRLMRGGQDDVQEKQLDVLEKIHEDLQGGGMENIMELAGA